VTWKQWLAKGDIKGHQTSKQELDNLRALIARDLADAAIRSPSRVLDIGSVRVPGTT
jgi:hypothetical protein